MGGPTGERVLLMLTLLCLGAGRQTVGPPLIPAVQCIVFNEDYMTCDWSGMREPEVNYSFYYWYGSSSKQVGECEHYLQNNTFNTGCRFDSFTLYTDFHIHLNDSRGLRPPHNSTMQLQNYVKPSPPINITLWSTTLNELTLNWSTRYPAAGCLEHAVKYMSNKDTDWMILDVKTSQPEVNVASVDPSKLYTFYVRSKLSVSCGTTNLWSEWAGPVIWGQNSTSRENLKDAGTMLLWIHRVLIPVGSFLLLLLFLTALVRMERVWLVLLPKIPNPSKRFEELFTAYQGNFSEWASVSKDAVESFKPNYHESICLVTELLPGGGYLPMCHGGSPGKGSTNPGPTVSPEKSPAGPDGGWAGSLSKTAHQ